VKVKVITLMADLTHTDLTLTDLTHTEDLVETTVMTPLKMPQLMKVLPLESDNKTPTNDNIFLP